MSIAKPDTFFTSGNLFNILKQVSIVSIVAVGQTFVMISGGIDLSVGFSLGLSGIIVSRFYQIGHESVPGGYLRTFDRGLSRFFKWLHYHQTETPPIYCDPGNGKNRTGDYVCLNQGILDSHQNPFYH